MTNRVVLDSNVFSKLFLQEKDRRLAVDLIIELGNRDIEILAPSLFLYEVLSVAAYSNFSTQSAYELMVQQQKVNLKLVEIDRDIVQTAIEITAQGHPNSGYPSFYDSAYHALAIQNECPFITADKKHQIKAEKFGYITLLQDWKTLF